MFSVISLNILLPDFLGYISLNKAAELINEVIDSVHSACKNDPMSAMIPRMPGTKNRPGGPFEIWRDYSKQLLKVHLYHYQIPICIIPTCLRIVLVLCQITSKNTSEVVDWRCLIVSFIDVHYHSFISTASVNDIVEAYSGMPTVSKICISSLISYSAVGVWLPHKD